ncbi:uncharacterized protein PV06_05664 [Exophiala oligosperma]|uniref:Uncharacterized protein n=1 Tax=Exophiala oligosperma TaxID=215243 RepID=A0A0D2DI39_9EURO|nr:uncharacterized protein PV06_05664 [Exophiala oligosperma]KIW42080.1 hypothetical protein PV06_05664 [Exophiala oligosperma]
MFDSHNQNPLSSKCEHGLRKAYQKAKASKSSKPSTSAKSTPASSASSSRTCSAASLAPTEPVAEWAHQVHLMQNRRYDWCQGCHPKVSTAQIPSQKILQKHFQNHEPYHAYQ